MSRQKSAFTSTLMPGHVPGVSEKKYGVADYQYFKNGETQQCDIFRLNKYNHCLVECEVSIPIVKRS